tara:strand:- start:1254 stop:2219 length:966 start_codon:yes stop_codon:yes gene_type:complete
MKYHDTHFEDYINSNSKSNLHPKLNILYQQFPEKIEDLKNIIFYGPKGVGKYTQMLSSIKKYSPTNLKYEKKISINYNKNTYYFKISDIHFEIDMSLLGCNSKLLWNEIYNRIVDITLAKSEYSGIIVCKYFHEINSELLETFYSYMQSLNNNSIDLKFIIITEQVSFIPENIINCCQLISVPRPTKTIYNKCLNNKIKNNITLEEISNIKNVESNITQLNDDMKIICNKIINEIINVNDMKFTNLRDMLYEIFIYNLDVSECLWYIVNNLIYRKNIKDEDISYIFLKTYNFFLYYNNNYRPIYHLESFIFTLTKKVHGFT